MPEPIYAIHDLQHGYDGRPVLEIPHLTLAPHTIVGLVGPNGSGKSTLLRLLAAVETPRRGRIDFEGANLAPFAPATRSRPASIFPRSTSTSTPRPPSKKSDRPAAMIPASTASAPPPARPPSASPSSCPGCSPNSA